MISALEGYFQDLGPLNAIGFSMLTSLPFIAIALMGLEELAFMVALFVYFPLHVWLVISLFLVVFSQLERQRMVGDDLTAIGGFFGRLISPFGLACATFFGMLCGWGHLMGVAK